MVVTMKAEKIVARVNITSRFLHEYFLKVAREGKPGMSYPCEMVPTRETDSGEYSVGTIWQQYDKLTNPKNTDTYAVDKYPELNNLYLYRETVVEDGRKVQKLRVTVKKDISKQFTTKDETK